jgi:cold shock CspA family protein
MRGKISKWIDVKSFGFVTPDQRGHDDVFIHENELPAHVRAENDRVGLIVEFDPVDAGKPRLSAKNVRILEDAR